MPVQTESLGSWLNPVKAIGGALKSISGQFQPKSTTAKITRVGGIAAVTVLPAIVAPPWIAVGAGVVGSYVNRPSKGGRFSVGPGATDPRDSGNRRLDSREFRKRGLSGTPREALSPFFGSRGAPFLQRTTPVQDNAIGNTNSPLTTQTLSTPKPGETDSSGKTPATGAVTKAGTGVFLTLGLIAAYLAQGD